MNSKERNYQIEVMTRGPGEDHVFTISKLTEKEAKMMYQRLIASDGQLKQVEIRALYGGVSDITTFTRWENRP